MRKRKEYKRGSFGEKLAALISSSSISKNDFCKRLEISKSYLFDLLNERSLPSEEMQVKIVQALGLKQKEIEAFYNLTAINKNGIPADIALFLKQHPERCSEVRKLLKINSKI